MGYGRSTNIIKFWYTLIKNLAYEITPHNKPKSDGFNYS